MTHTIALDQQQIDFERTNTWNAIMRHCKIGKVTRKTKPAPIWPAKPGEWWRQTSFPAYDPLGGVMIGSSKGKCSCSPGAVCMNVACPHMPVVTC